MHEHPPHWADALLRNVLPSDDRDCVSGDLLEAYRTHILPARGRAAADRWYLGQVWDHVWRATWPWAALFSGAFVARTAYDWLVPTTDFLARSTTTTAVSVTTLLAVGFWASRRARSVATGVMVAVLATQLGALFSVVGLTLLLAVRHDAATLRTIAGSGGLMEAYTLPFMAIVPAMFVGAIGSTVGSLTRRLQEPRSTPEP